MRRNAVQSSEHLIEMPTIASPFKLGLLRFQVDQHDLWQVSLG